MTDLLDITDKVLPVAVVGSGVTDPVDAYTDGQHFYFEDPDVARVGAFLTGTFDLAGRRVRIERTDAGWQEHRGGQVRQLHQRRVRGELVYRFDDEWLFAVVLPQTTPAHSV